MAEEEAAQAAEAEAARVAEEEAAQAAEAEAARVAEEEAAQAAEAEAASAAEEEVAPTEDPAQSAQTDESAEADIAVEAEPVEAGTTEQAETLAPVEESPVTETAEEAQPEATQTAESQDQPVIETVSEDTQAASEQARQEEAAASAATDADAEVAEVETEAVTEETSRSSDEEFAPQSQAAGQDKGLSKFEKALLVGLGAVVVGSVLRNGDKVVSNSGDRVVLEGEDGLRVLKDDNELLRRPGSDVRTETFNDGSTRTTVTRPNGNRIVTIAAADGRVIQRLILRPDGSEVVLIDDTERFEPVEVSTLPEPARPSRAVNIDDELALRIALQRQMQNDPGRNFSLSQVRGLRSVRELAPAIEVDALTFASGSAAIEPSQAQELVQLGQAISDVISETPEAVFLIEGHTDAVGGEAYNLALSDRRAETVALALSEYFDVPPENLITQGYGESALKVQTLADEQANRRAVVRNITTLLH